MNLPSSVITFKTKFFDQGRRLDIFNSLERRNFNRNRVCFIPNLQNYCEQSISLESVFGGLN